MKNLLNTCWLTINRDCNIRCDFCYAQNKLFSKRETMSFEMAQSLIDIAISNGVATFFLLGGEPTLHPAIIDILSYITNRDRKIIVVTNGIKLQDVSFCEAISRINQSQLITIAIALKGSSNLEYKKLCGVPAYDKVLKAVENCRKFNLKLNFSFVITSENVYDLEQIANKLKNDGINETISFSYCHDIIIRDKFEILDKLHPIEIDSVFSDKYDYVDKVLESNIAFHQTLPLCMCNKTMFDKMVLRKQITTACQLQKKNSVIFDTDGGILLCNHVNYSIGKYLEDFIDAESFKKYWLSSKVEELFKRITTMPSRKCLNCKDRQLCGGGCCIQWFASDFESYNNYLLTIKSNLNGKD
ncbi:MAG: radical SAM protein [Bacteroidales bacterium]|nr:radical SAM protein [Bacteroidales bacterium]